MQSQKASEIWVILCLLWMSAVSAVSAASGNARAPRASSNRDVAVVVTVNLQQSLNTITDHFIGHSLGWPTAVQLSQHFGSKRLQTLARALTPLWARMGGDYVKYVMDGVPRQGLSTDLMAAGWDLIMIISAKTPRNADGSWNATNARHLLRYSASKNYPIAGFELGNEYNLYKDEYKTMVTPQQLAKDVATFEGLLAEFPQYYSSFIMGPDTAGVDHRYFGAFLSAGGHKVVRAASFHEYYFPGGEQGNLSYFTDVVVMDKMKMLADKAFHQTRPIDPQLPVWLSETGSASNAGVKGMSDRFVAGFLWLDKLGVCAAKGIQAVIRHVFFSEHDYYGLLDKNLNPNPDYWLTVLYKRVVRGAVFNTTARHDVRVYAACANTDNFKAGSLAVYMLNPNNYPVTFDLPQFTNEPRFRYSLTAGDADGLVSKYMALNGVKLQLVNDSLPPLTPVSAPHGVVTVPAYSYTFLVFPDAGVSICMH